MHKEPHKAFRYSWEELLDCKMETVGHGDKPALAGWPLLLLLRPGADEINVHTESLETRRQMYEVFESNQILKRTLASLVVFVAFLPFVSIMAVFACMVTNHRFARLYFHVYATHHYRCTCDRGPLLLATRQDQLNSSRPRACNSHVPCKRWL